MLGRPDVSQYSKGCIKLQNFLVTPYGSVERRPGFYYVSKCRGNDVRLIRFAYSSDVSYVLEFGSFYIRFYQNGTPVMHDGKELEITSPYPSGALSGLKYVQSGDIMTLVHGDYPVYELKRLGETDFVLAQKYFEYPPVLDPNLDNSLTITPTGTLTVGGQVTLTASGDIFTKENEGGYFQLVHVRRNNAINKDFKGNGTSGVLEVYGYWTFITHGTWSGTVTIQRSFNGGVTWEDYLAWSSEKDRNISTSGTEEGENVYYRLRMTDYSQSDTGTIKACSCQFFNADFSVTGVVQVNKFESSQKMIGTVIRKIGSEGATTEWSEGAWSKRRGYPNAIAFYEERMFFGGTRHQPQTIWGSKTADWDNFLLGDKDDNGLSFTLASDSVNRIAWMCQHDALIIGTFDSEWILRSNSSDKAVTPSVFRLKRQSVYGSGEVNASMVGDTVLFVQRQGRKVREFAYNWEKDGYVSPDMTILADHITKSGIKETALQQSPDTVYWCVMHDGSISALTYERDQEVVGWHKHCTEGEFLSICVVPEGDTNRLYAAVKRRNGVFIEMMGNRDVEDLSRACFLDSAVTGSDPGDFLGGLEHLDGQEVCIVGDGAVFPAQVVKEGLIRVPEGIHTIIVGLPYESILMPMPLELEMQDGRSLLRRKITGEIRLRIYRSIGGEVRSNGSSWQTIYGRDVMTDNMDEAVKEKDEIISVHALGGYSETVQLCVRQCAPLPLNVTSIVVIYEVSE